MVGDEFYYLCRGCSKNALLLEKIMNAFKNNKGILSSVMKDLSYDTEISVDLSSSSLGVVVSNYEESYLIYGEEGAYYIVPEMNEPIKVVFDNGIQIVDESEPDYAEDYDTATDEEIEALIGIERGDRLFNL